MKITNKGKVVMLNKAERQPLEATRELLEGLANLPFAGQTASVNAATCIGKVLDVTAPKAVVVDDPTEAGGEGQ